MYIYTYAYICKHTNTNVTNCTYVLMEIIELFTLLYIYVEIFVTPENVTSFIEEISNWS